MTLTLGGMDRIRYRLRRPPTAASASHGPRWPGLTAANLYIVAFAVSWVR